MSFSLDLTTQDAIRFAVPLWLAGLGELAVQRSGVVNIGIEGMMLAGALAGWAGAVGTGSAGAGVMCAAMAGIALAACFAVVTIAFRADQIVAGTAINLIALGATGVGYKWCVQSGWAAQSSVHFEPLHLSILPIRAFDQFSLCYVTIALAVGLEILIRRTRWGIELTALGEYPAAMAAAGARVGRRRCLIVLGGGFLAGLAGSYLSIMFNHQFGYNMTAGRGFLALAMVIFGRWSPLGLIAGGLFFGYVYAVEYTLEVSPLPGLPAPQILQMAPYVLTLVVLAGLAGRTRAPAALGQPFEG